MFLRSKIFYFSRGYYNISPFQGSDKCIFDNIGLYPMLVYVALSGLTLFVLFNHLIVINFVE